MEPLDLVAQMASLLDEQGILYALGGSVASSLVGEPRSTVDIDVAIRPTADQVAPFLDAVRPEFYLSVSAAEVALAESGSFKVFTTKRRSRLICSCSGTRRLIELSWRGGFSIDWNWIRRWMCG